MLYSCLCTSFVSCYCVLTEKIDENDNVVTIDHFSRLRVGSLLVSFGDSNVWPSRLLQATVVPAYMRILNSDSPKRHKLGLWNSLWIAAWKLWAPDRIEMCEWEKPTSVSVSPGGMCVFKTWIVCIEICSKYCLQTLLLDMYLMYC